MDLLNVIKKAEERKVAVGHFNVSNLEQLKAITDVAKRLKVPVVIGVSEGEREFIGVQEIKALIDVLKKEMPAGIFLNADHTRSLKKVKTVIGAGYDSIVFDGSQLTFEENIRATREAVLLAADMNPKIVVEGEMGYIGSSSEIRKEIPSGAAIRPEDLTRPEEAARFVKETGVRMFAPAVGNIHGMFQNAPEPRLDIARIKAIRKAAGIPLTLHGASGNTNEDLRAAIEAGISLIHISTELRVAWRKGLEESLKDNPEEVAPYKLMPEDLKVMEKVVEEKLRLFNKI